ncbi:MAG: hypothetical protein WED05_09625 [Candidatus Atabeyarchaeum deiterrae]
MVGKVLGSAISTVLKVLDTMMINGMRGKMRNPNTPMRLIQTPRSSSMNKLAAPEVRNLRMEWQLGHAKPWPYIALPESRLPQLGHLEVLNLTTARQLRHTQPRL